MVLLPSNEIENINFLAEYDTNDSTYYGLISRDIRCTNNSMVMRHYKLKYIDTVAMTFANIEHKMIKTIKNRS